MSIRKILIIDNQHYGHISKLIDMANITKHKAFLHNGIVYVEDPSDCMNWIQTVFTIEDFEQ